MKQATDERIVEDAIQRLDKAENLAVQVPQVLASRIIGKTAEVRPTAASMITDVVGSGRTVFAGEKRQ